LTGFKVFGRISKPSGWVVETFERRVSLGAELAGSLIECLDATVDEAAEAAWNQEIARRIEDLDSGKAKTVPWEAVRFKL
jgi:putative addiction module component (TIGR02574 family)